MNSPSVPISLVSRSMPTNTRPPAHQSFLVAQLTLAFFPLVLFSSFVLSVVSFVLVAGLLFSLFWIGVALAVLAPTLAVACGLASLLWAWAVGSFVVARWLYNLVPVGVRGGIELEKQPNGGVGTGTKLVVRKDEDGVRAEKVEGGEVVY